MSAVVGRKPRDPSEVREPALAARLEEAADKHPHCPPKHFGRLEWVVQQVEKRGSSISQEMVRKWFGGLGRPNPNKFPILADVFGVDVAWLERGLDKNVTPKERRYRQSAVDGTVSLVAGLIQMDGGKSAMPEEDDTYARDNYIDLYATIKGTRYPLHISLGEPDGDRMKFGIPKNLENVIVIGVVRDGFSMQVYEITEADIRQYGRGTGVRTTQIVVADGNLKRIENFATRL